MSLDTLDPILSEQELAAWLNTSRPTLQRQRSDGSGPEFIQLSERRIGYRKSAVERWLISRTANRIGDWPRHGLQEAADGASDDASDLHRTSSAPITQPKNTSSFRHTTLEIGSETR